jgi:hypothetical protein
LPETNTLAYYENPKITAAIFFNKIGTWTAASAVPLGSSWELPFPATCPFLPPSSHSAINVNFYFFCLFVTQGAEK